ncbi:hypothetical protein SAMN05216232_3013 [Virgibacillus subterraneus]|uniref:Uncharacterized protein n=1 Tax=Virgibacillus subterraneus TaxID=621109 RepID=A0A1H9HSK8_9BACI|nr:hypothetical protein [Virgibacillus subterraneus]SEQ65354.1 hypothetical protein SAMN05216232_3013 [Virgibacillus subterraneus]
MYIMATFDHSVYLELALAYLEKEDIPKANILAVPLDSRKEKMKLFDTLHKSDGLSLFDMATAFATAFAVIGASVGFHLELGPIIWGIFGAVGGFVLGFVIKLIIQKLKQNHRIKMNNKSTELILIIHCNKNQVEIIEKLLWEHLAFGVAVLDNNYQSQ